MSPHPKATLFAALVLSVTTLFTLRAAAWNDFGHMQVAAVAYKALDQRTKTRVHELLKRNPSYPYWIVGAAPGQEGRAAFLRASTWADAIKSDKTYLDDKPGDASASRLDGYAGRFKHSYWHYINEPFSADGSATRPAPTPNVATMIMTLSAVLAGAGDTTTGASKIDEAREDLESFALVWLLHLVGDVHQPLHCVARFDRQLPEGDRGGNLVRIAGAVHAVPCDDPRYCGSAPSERLHVFVDSILGSAYGVSQALAAASSLPRAKAAEAAILDPMVWVAEGVQLAQRRIYVTPIGVGSGPFTIDAQFRTSVAELARERISLAGARLAKVLTAALSARSATR